MHTQDMIDVIERSRKLMMKGLPPGLAINYAMNEKRKEVVSRIYDDVKDSLRHYKEKAKGVVR